MEERKNKNIIDPATGIEDINEPNGEMFGSNNLHPRISRRAFLKLGGAAAASLFLPSCGNAQENINTEPSSTLPNPGLGITPGSESNVEEPTENQKDPPSEEKKAEATEFLPGFIPGFLPGFNGEVIRTKSGNGIVDTSRLKELGFTPYAQNISEVALKSTAGDNSYFSVATPSELSYVKEDGRIGTLLRTSDPEGLIQEYSDIETGELIQKIINVLPDFGDDSIPVATVDTITPGFPYRVNYIKDGEIVTTLDILVGISDPNLAIQKDEVSSRITVESGMDDYQIKVENGKGAWSKEKLTANAEDLEKMMERALRTGARSFNINDPNGIEVVIDVPTNEEAIQEIINRNARWEWGVRCYIRQNPETRRLQELRYYDERGKWTDVFDTIGVPEFGIITLIGDTDALANPQTENRPSIKNPRFAKTEQAVRQWENGLGHLFSGKSLIELKQVDSFQKANNTNPNFMNYPVEPANIKNGVTFELLPEYGAKQAIGIGKVGDGHISWYVRTESGRLIISLNRGLGPDKSKYQGFPNLTRDLFNIFAVGVLNWIKQEPSNVQISKAGYIINVNAPGAKLLPEVAEVMTAFYGYKPSNGTYKELLAQMKNPLLEVESY